MSKTVIIGAEARKKILRGVNTLADAVSATLGPRGKNVAIEVSNVRPPTITKDGVTVARYITLSDRIENLGSNLVKSVAVQSNQKAGDGTTTATVLAREFYSQGLKMVEAGQNPVLLKRGMDLAVKHVVSRLDKMAIPVDDEDTLSYVAKISANNDRELGSLIAEAMSTVGDNGVLTVEESPGRKTSVEYSEGIRLERGLMHTDFITNPSRLTCDLEDAAILLYDGKISSINELLPILKEAAQAGRPIVIVPKDIEKDAVLQLVYNVGKGSISACVVRCPGFGDHRRAFLDDLAAITRGVVADTPQKLQALSFSQLGTVKKFSANLNFSTVVGGAATQEEIDQEVALITKQLEAGELFDWQEDVLRARLTRLCGGAAIFKVGGQTETEARERRDRVEDAINAVKSALEMGIVPGGGAALVKCISCLDKIDTSNLLQEEVIGIDVVRRSISAPFLQIMRNAGSDRALVYLDKIANSERAGFDALRMEFSEDLISDGIIDPLKVVRSSLEHAASASGTLLTTEVVIVDDDEEEKV